LGNIFLEPLKKLDGIDLNKEGCIEKRDFNKLEYDI
jgi:hypothetical protein